jgi:hypothetical protein
VSKYDKLILLRRSRPRSREAIEDKIQYFYEGYDSFDDALNNAAGGDSILTVYLKTQVKVVTKYIKEVEQE